MKRPAKHLGMRHLALFVEDLAAAEHFYIELLGMDVEWRPDDANVYLTSQGHDNLALHSKHPDLDTSGGQKLDHLGFIMNTAEEVDQWYEFFKENGVQMLTEPRRHRDGATSFYCLDPDGNRVQMIHHPPIVSSI
ncbi:VOC family protein [Kangiella japonica]|uniref:VOC family protein n=1 Tax=Kangiella japonica TaxID=647384 RepID=A0ABN0SZI9_9GAMM